METTSAGFEFQPIYIPPTKKDIIQRLFMEQKINFEEMWILMQNEVEVRYISYPQPYPVPSYPYLQPIPYWTTCVANGASTFTASAKNSIQ